MRFWRPDVPGVLRMVRVENEDRRRVTYADAFMVIVVCSGAFDGWYRGERTSHAAGGLKLKEPGEVHRDVEVHAPFTLQVAAFAPEIVAAAADAVGLRGAPRFTVSSFAPGERATELAFAMHDALVRTDAGDLERATLVAETLAEVLGAGTSVHRAPRPVRRARALLHDAVAEKVTLDALASHAGLDKFHLVRAFRNEVGLPPYEYLTQLRIARARDLLERGVGIAEAAQAVGFCDQSQLHRHFRRIVGLAPGAYARSLGPSRARSSQHRPRHEQGSERPSLHERSF